MPLPDLTHLQFAVLSIVGGSEKSGREVRERLTKEKLRMSGPAFYQLMARLEESKFVAGHYLQKIVEGQIIKDRRYKITAQGLRAWNDAREFYSRQDLNAAKPGWAV